MQRIVNRGERKLPASLSARLLRLPEKRLAAVMRAAPPPAQTRFLSGLAEEQAGLVVGAMPSEQKAAVLLHLVTAKVSVENLSCPELFRQLEQKEQIAVLNQAPPEDAAEMLGALEQGPRSVLAAEIDALQFGRILLRKFMDTSMLFSKIVKVIEALYEHERRSVFQFLMFWSEPPQIIKRIKRPEIAALLIDSAGREGGALFRALGAEKAAKVAGLLTDKEKVFADTYDQEPAFLPAVCEKMTEAGFGEYEALLNGATTTDLRLQILRALPKNQHYPAGVAAALSDFFRMTTLTADQLDFLLLSGHEELAKYVAVKPAAPIGIVNRALAIMPAITVTGSPDHIMVYRGAAEDSDLIVEREVAHGGVELRPLDRMSKDEFEEDRHLAWILHHGRRYLKDLASTDQEFYNLVLDILPSLKATLKVRSESHWKEEVAEVLKELKKVHDGNKEGLGEAAVPLFFRRVLPPLDETMAAAGIGPAVEPLLELGRKLTADPDRKDAVPIINNYVLPRLLTLYPPADALVAINGLLFPAAADEALETFQKLAAKDEDLGLTVAWGLTRFIAGGEALRKYLGAGFLCRREIPVTEGGK
jgi:hypothetical protein